MFEILNNGYYSTYLYYYYVQFFLCSVFIGEQDFFVHQRIISAVKTVEFVSDGCHI